MKKAAKPGVLEKTAIGTINIWVYTSLMFTIVTGFIFVLILCTFVVMIVKATFTNFPLDFRNMTIGFIISFGLFSGSYLRYRYFKKILRNALGARISGLR